MLSTGVRFSMSRFREKVEKKQNLNNMVLHFDPDSSPIAWEHYKKYYTDDFWRVYDINSPIFFNNVFDNNTNGFRYGKKNEKENTWYNYVDSPIQEKNRLIAITVPTDFIEDEYSGCKFYSARLRLGGEVDFNFNEKHTRDFKDLIFKENNTENREECLNLLERCEETHHTFLNFSLMQSMGDMQGFKGSHHCKDRLDKFLFYLKEYYEVGTDELRKKSKIIQYATKDNSIELFNFLNRFDDANDYINKVYFIDEDAFIDRLVKNGKKEITNATDVVEYMNLAMLFWEKKEAYLIKNDKELFRKSILQAISG